jgi:hypothetical protein
MFWKCDHLWHFDSSKIFQTSNILSIICGLNVFQSHVDEYSAKVRTVKQSLQDDVDIKFVINSSNNLKFHNFAINLPITYFCLRLYPWYQKYRHCLTDVSFPYVVLLSPKKVWVSLCRSIVAGTFSEHAPGIPEISVFVLLAVFVHMCSCGICQTHVCNNVSILFCRQKNWTHW